MYLFLKISLLSFFALTIGCSESRPSAPIATESESATTDEIRSEARLVASEVFSRFKELTKIECQNRLGKEITQSQLAIVEELGEQLANGERDNFPFDAVVIGASNGGTNLNGELTVNPSSPMDEILNLFHLQPSREEYREMVRKYRGVEKYLKEIHGIGVFSVKLDETVANLTETLSELQFVLDENKGEKKHLDSVALWSSFSPIARNGVAEIPARAKSKAIREYYATLPTKAAFDAQVSALVVRQAELKNTYGLDVEIDYPYTTLAREQALLEELWMLGTENFFKDRAISTVVVAAQSGPLKYSGRINICFSDSFEKNKAHLQAQPVATAMAEFRAAKNSKIDLIERVYGLRVNVADHVNETPAQVASKLETVWNAFGRQNPL